MVGSRRRFLQAAAVAAVMAPMAAAEAQADDVDEAGRVRALFARRHGLAADWVMVCGGAADALHYAVLAFTSPTRGLVGQGAALRRAAAVSGARVELEAEASGVGMIFLGGGAAAEEVERALRKGAVVVTEGAPVMRDGQVSIVRLVAGCAVVVARPDLLGRMAAFSSGVVEGRAVTAARRRLEGLAG